MIVLCGVDEFPSGPWTENLASCFADRVGAELHIVDGGSAHDHVAAVEGMPEGVLLFGHAPPRAVTATLREAPCPVVVAPAGVSAGNWRQVVLGCRRGSCSEEAAATAGLLAARLDALLRVVVLQPESGSTGWQTSDGMRRLTRAAAVPAGPDLPVIEPEARSGPPAATLLEAAEEHDGSLIVLGADPRPSWVGALRPSFTAQVVHGSREPVVVVPRAPRPDEPHLGRGRGTVSRA